MPACPGTEQRPAPCTKARAAVQWAAADIGPAAAAPGAQRASLHSATPTHHCHVASAPQRPNGPQISEPRHAYGSAAPNASAEAPPQTLLSLLPAACGPDAAPRAVPICGARRPGANSSRQLPWNPPARPDYGLPWRSPPPSAAPGRCQRAAKQHAHGTLPRLHVIHSVWMGRNRAWPPIVPPLLLTHARCCAWQLLVVDAVTYDAWRRDWKFSLGGWLW